MILNEATPFLQFLEKTVDDMETHLTSNAAEGVHIKGLSTGYSDLDKMIGGLKQGLYVIAGSSEMRTDTLQRNIIEHASLTGDKTVLHFECNLNNTDFTNFCLSSIGRIDITKMSQCMLGDEEWERLSSTMGLLSEKINLELCDCAGMTTDQLEEQVKKVSQRNQLSMISINSMHNLRLPFRTENRYNEMAEVSRFLKELSKKYEVPVVVTASINRRLIERSDKRPILSDLRDTGTIGDDADYILFVYRDEVYHEDSAFGGMAEVIIAKNQTGGVGRIPLTYIGPFSRFENYVGNMLWE
jgi:replicative DNA helicase